MKHLTELTSTEKLLRDLLDPLFHATHHTVAKESEGVQQNTNISQTPYAEQSDTKNDTASKQKEAAANEKKNETIAKTANIETGYMLENKIMLAISQGQTQKAELLFAQLCEHNQKQKRAGSIQEYKNECIVMNTLFRKAAESSDVHPIHIDSLSTKLTQKIEQISSGSASQKLQSEMIHKYCILVKNHSLQGYSILIRQVLTRIDSDLTADHSLRTQAKLLNINSSYLSTLFKKEVGITLTDYVNTKRVEHAIFLLNTTTLQIQAIARHCGILDVNYFTKTFKRHIGKTPKEYRDSIALYRKQNEE